MVNSGDYSGHCLNCWEIEIFMECLLFYKEIYPVFEIKEIFRLKLASNYSQIPNYKPKFKSATK